MKNKINIVFGILFIMSCVVIAGLVVEKQKLENAITFKEKEIIKVRQENYEANNKLFTVTNKVADLAYATQKTINKEEDCALRAKKAFLSEKNEIFAYSTYSSHWNILDKACYIQVNLREKLQNGNVVQAGFGVYDLTNDKQKISCFILNELTETTTMKTCEDSLLKAQDYMSN